MASHIKPWSSSNDEEKLDVHNSILLSPNIDAFFDNHLISFDKNGHLVISNRINSNELKKLSIDPNCQIIITTEMVKYLDLHLKHLKYLET
jgi:predicted restriction endonuclease